jgi:hypothetical protein
MSTQSIITVDNLPTSTAMAQYLNEASMDLLQALRFEIGCVDNDKIQQIIRLHKLICNDYCYINCEQDRLIREELIRNSITRLYDI